MNICIKNTFRSMGILENGAVYYIGGSDILPSPLSKEEEQLALERLQEGSEAAKKLLIERNLRLVVFIARRFENTGVFIEDLISIGTIGLIKAVNTFRPDKNIKLATYSSRCIENEILMYIRKYRRKRRKYLWMNPSIRIGTATSFCFPMCWGRRRIPCFDPWRRMWIMSFFWRH